MDKAIRATRELGIAMLHEPNPTMNLSGMANQSAWIGNAIVPRHSTVGAWIALR
jgi:hypothetical protein